MDNELNVLYGDAVEVWKVFTCHQCNKSVELPQEIIFNTADANDNNLRVRCLQCGTLLEYNLNTQFDIDRYQKLPYRIVRKG